MSAFMHELREKGRTAHRTESDILIWAGSGSAGWEAGIVNLLSPGDTVVATVCGAFGERFAWLGGKFGLNVHRVEVEWGRAVTPEMFGEALDVAGDVKAVFITHNETSTGVTNPLKELAALARAKNALVLVDAVSSAGAMELCVDEWDLDWAFSGVQKAWMCPPGLMMAAVSERAIHASKTAGFKRFYFDLAPMLQAAREGSTATTPAVSLLYALDAALDAIHEEGLENVWARHIRLGEAFRAGMVELGVEVLAESGYESSSVTAFRTPGGLSSTDLQERITNATGIVIATGQGPLAKTVNRVGHMGWTEQLELDATLEAIGAAMR
ncbi:MAG: alanine--glyoxylate aminotransferase family protein [Chloroflexota bacterium]|nr:alanine--glyoxylate aminotransferase family protein [Chloroflexota bacterium]